MFGYEGYVKINGNVVLATSSSISLDRNKIESSAIYGGSVNGDNAPLQSIHYFDWPMITANVSLDVNSGVLETIKAMILNREVPVNLYIHSRIDGEKELKQAWWNTISLQVGTDSALTATISFVAIERDDYKVGVFSSYWQNQNGLLNCSEILDPLNQGQENLNPIPFWKTTIPEFENVKSWSFNLSQDVVRFHGCMNYSPSTAVEPYILGFGQMRGEVTINTLCPQNNTTDIFNMPTNFTRLDVTSSRRAISVFINGSGFIGFDGELTKMEDPLQDNASVDDIEWMYDIYSINQV